METLFKIFLVILKIYIKLSKRDSRFDKIILGGNLNFPIEVLKEAFNYYDGEETWNEQ
jgi:hypothetical protein